MSNTRCFFTALALLGWAASGARAQIATFTFSNPQTVANAAHAATTPLSGGSAYYYANTTSGGANKFSVATGATSSGLAGAFADNAYVSFTVTPDSGYQFSVTGLSGTAFSNNADRNFYIESSVGGFGASPGNVLSTIAVAGTSGYPNRNDLPFNNSFSVTGASATEFRIYIEENAAFSNSGFSEDDSAANTPPLTLLGTVSPIAAAPEPSPWAAFAIGLLGLGLLRGTARRRAC